MPAELATKADDGQAEVYALVGRLHKHGNAPTAAKRLDHAADEDYRRGKRVDFLDRMNRTHRIGAQVNQRLFPSCHPVDPAHPV